MSAIKPVIHTAAEYPKLLPETGIATDIMDFASEGWERVRGMFSSAPAEKKEEKLSSAQSLVSKMNTYIDQASVLRVTGEESSDAYKKAQSDFYEAFKIRAKEFDWKVDSEKALSLMLEESVQALKHYTPAVKEEMIKRFKKEVLECLLPEIAERCASNLFALSTKQTKDLDRKAGLVSVPEAEEIIKTGCRTFWERIAELSDMPVETSKESEALFSDDEEIKEDTDKAIKKREQVKQAAQAVQKIPLPFKKKQALEKQFRDAVRTCIVDKIRHLKTELTSKCRYDLRKAVYDEYMAQGHQLDQEIKTNEITQSKLITEIECLERAVERPTTEDLRARIDELGEKKEQLRKIREALIDQRLTSLNVAQLTDPATRDPGLEEEGQKAAEQAIQALKKIEERLYSELFPRPANRVVQDVTKLVVDVLNAPREAENRWEALRDAATGQLGKGSGVVGPYKQYVKAKYNHLKKGASEASKVTTQYLGDRKHQLAKIMWFNGGLYLWAGWGGYLATEGMQAGAQIARAALPIGGEIVGGIINGLSVIPSAVSEIGFAPSKGLTAALPTVLPALGSAALSGVSLASQVNRYAVSQILTAACNTLVAAGSAAIDHPLAAVVTMGVAGAWTYKHWDQAALKKHLVSAGYKAATWMAVSALLLGAEWMN